MSAFSRHDCDTLTARVCSASVCYLLMSVCLSLLFCLFIFVNIRISQYAVAMVLLFSLDCVHVELYCFL